MRAVSCRPLPLWRRVPVAIFSAVVLIIALFLFFTICPLMAFTK